MLKNIEIMYFHQSYNNEISDISDVGYSEKNICGIKIKRPDPLYIKDKNTNITSINKINQIKKITLGFCRPGFRKSIFSKINDDDKIIYHFFIIKYKNGKRFNKYVISGELNKKLTQKNHDLAKNKLKSNLFYLNLNLDYNLYKYKYSVTREYDPLLVFDAFFDKNIKDFTDISELNNTKFKNLIFQNGNKFTSTSQTLGYCPYIIN